MEKFYDSHCHLFNEKYVLRSLLSSKQRKLRKFLARNFDIIKPTVEDSFHDLLSQYASVKIPEQNVHLFVLTYDLDLIFQTKYYQAYLPKIFFPTKTDSISLFKNSKLVKKINQLLETNYSYKYEQFLQDHLKLREKYPRQISLFYYFDPRRPHSLAYVKKFVKTSDSDNKPFVGIKLYPQNGYSPLDPTMLELYDYCEKYQIPIIVHFSYGGFSSLANSLEVKGAVYLNGKIHHIKHIETFEFKHKAIDEQRNIILPELFLHRYQIVRERANLLNHPKLWILVLEQFKNLKISFAHYGMENKLWTHYVVYFLENFPNTFTDIACTDKADLKYFMRFFTPEILPKILYGSDYVLNELDFVPTYKYYKKIRRLLGKKTLKHLAQTNPPKFLYRSTKQNLLV